MLILEDEKSELRVREKANLVGSVNFREWKSEVWIWDRRFVFDFFKLKAVKTFPILRVFIKNKLLFSTLISWLFEKIMEINLYSLDQTK